MRLGRSTVIMEDRIINMVIIDMVDVATVMEDLAIVMVIMVTVDATTVMANPKLADGTQSLAMLIGLVSVRVIVHFHIRMVMETRS